MTAEIRIATEHREPTRHLSGGTHRSFEARLGDVTMTGWQREDGLVRIDAYVPTTDRRYPDGILLSSFLCSEEGFTLEDGVRRGFDRSREHLERLGLLGEVAFPESYAIVA